MTPSQQDTIARLQEAVEAWDAATTGVAEQRAESALMSLTHPTAIRSLLDLLREKEAQLEALREATNSYIDAQGELDNRELLGPNAPDFDTLMRQRNRAMAELDTALFTPEGR